MRHGTLAAGLLLLVVLAGCGSAPPSRPRSPTGTAPARTPTGSAGEPHSTTGSRSGSKDAAVDPASVPGVRADGVDVTRLTAAHDAALNGTAYVLNASVRRGDARQRIVVTTAGPRPTLIRSESPSRTRVEYYDERFYRRTIRDGTVTYRTGSFVGDPAFSGASMIRQYMSMARYAPSGTTTPDGTPLVVLDAGREDLRRGAFGNATATSFSSRALVDADGVVRSFSFRATGRTADGRPFVVRVDLQVTGIGDTVVGAPDWLREARTAAATPRPETTGATGTTGTTTTPA